MIRLEDLTFHYREGDFRLSHQDAASLLASSVHWLTRLENVEERLEELMAPSRASFSSEQAASTLEIMERVARVGGGMSDAQSKLIDATRASFARRFPTVESR